MQDLRLIGVHEDGEHVLLSDAEGKRYRVALDEAMRAAARRDRPRLGQLQIEIDGGLRPRDVQALIRSGLSTEEVADRAGWTIEKVQRFEGPVLGEREYVANQARACIVGTSKSAVGVGSRYGSGTGPGAEQTLGSRSDERFKERGVPAELVRWDSARLDDGQWTVTALFPAGGRERTAAWRFDPRLRSLVPVNDEARWLSEESTGDAAIPTPHVATDSNRASAVFDVEAEGGVDEEKPPRRAKSREPIDLMAAMREQSTRSRRGRRRSSPTHTPVEESPREDALPLEDLVMDTADAPEPPVARGKHPVAAHLDERAPDNDGEVEDELGDLDDDVNVTPGNVTQLGATTTIHEDIDVDDPEVDDTDDTDFEIDLETDEDDVKDSVPDTADRPDHAPVDEAPAAGKPTAPKPAATGRGGRKSAGRKSGRPSVPSWDDIMFGGGRGGSTT
ncbi:septation protein SepH [Knoellia sp. S7-12]|uniref:septation protein SepH n=1 Tax=Knoellia sp. S7-12 TaxID=3126698 RepID=UPI003366584F